MNKKLGFTFIELIFAIAISSILSIMLYMSYYQTSKSSKNLDRIISIDLRASVLQNQFERDFTGVFVPNINEPKSDESPEPKSKEGTAKKENKPQKESPPEKVQFLPKTFYSENQNKNLKEITFITCNPLEIYGQTKPRIARVIYKLKEDKQKPNSFSLFRQESLEIKYGEQKENIEYEVVDNIKNLTFEFLIPEELKKEKSSKELKDKAKKAKEESKNVVDFKILNEWKFENKKDNQFKIPLFINVKITFWEDADQKREQKFEFKYYVFAFDSQFIKIKSEGQKKLEELLGAIQSQQNAEGEQNKEPKAKTKPEDKKK